MVAEEVRNLTRRSTQAAQDIPVLIEESVKNADADNQRVSEVADAIQSIADDASKAQQYTGVEHISKSPVQMEQPTQQTAAGAEERASANHELKAQAESMQNVIAELEALAAA